MVDALRDGSEYITSHCSHLEPIKCGFTTKYMLDNKRKIYNNKPEVVLITGGPGTGKTYYVQQLSTTLDPSELIITSTTGKGRQVLQRGISSRVYTTMWALLHLELGGKTVVIDEVSMLDQDTLLKVILKYPKKLILVGDPNQLPSVLLGNVIETFDKCSDTRIRLKEQHRMNSSVLNQSKLLLEENKVEYEEIDKDRGYACVNREDDKLFEGDKIINRKNNKVCANGDEITVEKIEMYKPFSGTYPII
jgi:ATP-dependent exoDNAse (exonuclease V) alpha subunit